MESTRRPSRWPLAVAVVFLMLYGWLALLTLWDYGLTWDAWEYYVGDKQLYFYATQDPGYFDFRRDDIRIYDRPGTPDFHEVTTTFADNDVMIAPHLVWPFGPFTTSCTKLLLHVALPLLPAVEAHHLAVVGWGLALLALVYWLGRRWFGPWAGLGAMVFLALHPRWIAHLHTNAKDVPSAVLFTAVTALCVVAVEREHWRWLAGSAVLWGISLAVKPNALFVPLVLAPWFLYLLWRRRRDPCGRLPGWGIRVVLAVYPVIALAGMFAAWPYLLADFPRVFLLYLESLGSRGYAGEGSWQVMPLLMAAITTPLPMLVALFGGLGVIVWQTLRRRRLDARHLLLLTWLVVPILRVSWPGARDFDGIRHWLEWLPAAALAAGLAVQALADAAGRWVRRYGVGRGDPRRRAAWVRGAVATTLLVWCLPTIAWDFRAHPNQLVFFNSLIGGLDGARARGIPQAGDYWGQSYRQGLNWLNAHAPPNSRLAVGVAEHIVWYVRETQLRPDIQLLPTRHMTAPELAARIAESPAPVYVMYVPRWANEAPVVRPLDGRVEPVHEVRVDGAAILRILQPTAEQVQARDE